MTAFIDTNVLIYAQGSGAKSETARQAILAGGVISVQVLNEFAAVLRRLGGIPFTQAPTTGCGGVSSSGHGYP